MSNYKDIWSQCETIIQSQAALKEKMQAICDFLGSHMPAYDWVGFYLSDVKNKKLHLELDEKSRMKTFLTECKKNLLNCFRWTFFK